MLDIDTPSNGNSKLNTLRIDIWRIDELSIDALVLSITINKITEPVNQILLLLVESCCKILLRFSTKSIANEPKANVFMLYFWRCLHLCYQNYVSGKKLSLHFNRKAAVIVAQHTCTHYQ